MAFQGDPRTNRIRGKEKPAGPALLIIPFLVVLSFLYINIYINTTLANSHAVNDTDSYSFNLADTTNLSISLPAPETLTLTPSAEGVFGSKSIAVGVSTNSPYGYTLTMSAASSSLSRSAAVGGVTPTIPALETAVSEADFPNNYWGFKRTSTAIADTNYQPMLANHSVLVNNTSANADSSSSTITFGVKLSNETPSGDYSINIDFLAVTNVAPNLYYMQDATSTSLAAAMPSVGDTTVLYDRRDGQEYTIAKLKDGKYWMTKNLNLAGGTVLTSEDTDMAPGYTMPTTYVDPDSGATLPTGFGEGNSLPASSKTGFDNDYKAFIYNTDNNTDTCTDPGCYSYYSYNAATLGSGMDISSDNADAPYSVCPKGWKLPTSRSTLELAKTSSDFYQMAIHYGLNPADVNENPDNAPTFCSLAGDGGDCGNKTIPNFLRAGYYLSSAFYGGSTDGIYWSLTASGSISARNLHFTSGDVYSAYNANRRYGFTVRCLFDATMQNFSQDDAAAMAEHQVETLVDARDGQNYTVAKLKDGKVWMTKNLNLAGGTTLTPADTDMPTGYVLSTAYGFQEENKLPESYIVTDGTTINGGFSENTVKADIYNTGIECNYWGPCSSYYSWTAATLGSGVDIHGDNNDAPYSICPKGWQLPSIRTTQDAGGDFNNLMIAYGMSTESTIQRNASLIVQQFEPGTVPNFIYSGDYYNSMYSPMGAAMVLTSRTAKGDSGTFLSNLWGDNIELTLYATRRWEGNPVRCLLRTE